MSTHWNYRVLAKKVLNDVQYGIYEVHYENDIPKSCTMNEISSVAFDSDIEDQIDSMIWQLDAMKLACGKPVLDYDDFPKEYIKYNRKKKLKEIEKYFK